MKYPEPKENTWVQPVKKGYKFMCCDCGLVHEIDFEHIKWGQGRKIVIRVRRNERATSAARRKYKKT